MIEENVLREFGAEQYAYSRDSAIFKQGNIARFYFEIAEGEVKMCNYSEDGKEFIQGIFSAGRCFGEPPLFGDFAYPAHAIALTDCRIWQLPKASFYQLLKDHPEVHFKITAEIASRLCYKAMMAQEMSHEDPQHRILTLLEYLKKDVCHLTEKYSYQVELTRQQIGDLTGLRVETAIRAIKKMEKEGLIKIVHRKIKI